MRLRKLELKDAPLMLEWMHDPSVAGKLQTNFAAKTMGDCVAFIQAAKDQTQNLHLAIVDENNVYMGTVSLKRIKNGKAEFAITVRTVAMGKGYSKYGMSEIIRIGLEDRNLNSVFWCVNPDNMRAIRFYDKNGYQRIDKKGLSVEGYTQLQVNNYIWYEVTAERKIIL